METDDELLAQFERQAVAEKAAVASADGEDYAAFKPVDKRQLSLHLRPVGEPFLWAKYGYFLYASATPSGRRLDVAFSFALVTITGRNLHEVGDAIANERCAFVQQFDAKQWKQPKDDSAPFIASIVYLMTKPQDVTGEQEAGETQERT